MTKPKQPNGPWLVVRDWPDPFREYLGQESGAPTYRIEGDPARAVQFPSSRAARRIVDLANSRFGAAWWITRAVHDPRWAAVDKAAQAAAQAVLGPSADYDPDYDDAGPRTGR